MGIAPAGVHDAGKKRSRRLPRTSAASGRVRIGLCQPGNQALSNAGRRIWLVATPLTGFPGKPRMICLPSFCVRVATKTGLPGCMAMPWRTVSKPASVAACGTKSRSPMLTPPVVMIIVLLCANNARVTTMKYRQRGYALRRVPDVDRGLAGKVRCYPQCRRRNQRQARCRWWLCARVAAERPQRLAPVIAAADNVVGVSCWPAVITAAPAGASSPVQAIFWPSRIGLLTVMVFSSPISAEDVLNGDYAAIFWSVRRSVRTAWSGCGARSRYAGANSADHCKGVTVGAAHGVTIHRARSNGG